MAKYRDRLPQLSGKPFLTDGGLETTLIFHNNLELPYFAAFDLLKDDSGCAVLREYFKPYVPLAQNTEPVLSWTVRPGEQVQIGPGNSDIPTSSWRN